MNMFGRNALEKVISGGQTGVDLAGLLAAKELGIATGGWMPRGMIAEDGPHPDFIAMFGMAEHPSPLYPPRTRMNIRSSCATLCLESITESRGVALTLREATKASKPVLRVVFLEEGGKMLPQKTPAEVAEWIIETKVAVLNIAGNSESRSPGTQEAARHYLLEVFRLVQALKATA